jgi:hypothetical protein
MRRLLNTGLIFLLLVLLGVLAIPTLQTSAQTTTNPSSAIWTASYYNNTNFSGTPVTTSYTGLNLTFPGSPITGIGDDNWSARYTANISLGVGIYTFTVRSDDTAQLTLTFSNGSFVIGDLTPTGLTTVTETVQVFAAGAASLEVELIEITNDAIIEVTWTQTGGGGATQIPVTTGPTVTPVPPLTVAVVGVQGLSVRTGPFLGASRVAVARPSTQYPVLARNNQEGLFTWYLIQFDEDTVGWSSGRYLELTGEETSVPEIGSTDFDRTDDPRGLVTGVTRSVMNLRIFPTPRVPRVIENPQIPWGGHVELLARTVQGGEDFWYQVRYIDEDGAAHIGWILAAYVGIDRNSDPIESVPIR